MSSMISFSLLFLLITLSNFLLYQQNEGNQTEDPFSWLKNIFERGIKTAEDFGSYILEKLIKMLLFVARIVYIILAIVGLILWLSGLQPFKGRRYTFGAVALAIAVEILTFMLL